MWARISNEVERERTGRRTSSGKDIDQIFEEGTLIDAALAQGVQDALRLHKQVGLPIAVWENGKTVWIPAEKVSVLERDGEQRAS